MRKITERTIQKFKEDLINGEKSKATIEKYIRDITAFCIWLKNADICKTKVLQYKEYLKETYAPASVNSILSSLNSFFEYNKAYDLKVKTLKIQRQIFAARERELTKAEYERLLMAAKTRGNEKLYFLMQTICATGIRVSESQYITVESLKVQKATISLKGKLRMILLPKALCRMLLKYAKAQNIATGPVFITKSGNPLNRSNIWKMMKALCAAAMVDAQKVFPHNLRHLFARTFYALQNDIVRLADILGHSSINTTRIYTVETGEIHRRQLQELGLLKC